VSESEHGVMRSIATRTCALSTSTVSTSRQHSFV